MRKVLKYMYRAIPLLVVLFIMLAFSDDVAADTGAGAGAPPAEEKSWWEEAGDWIEGKVEEAKQFVVDKVKENLGIDLRDNCDTPTSYDRNCMFCPMFRAIFNASSKVAQGSYSAFASDLGELLVVFLAVSIALMTLRNVATMGAKDPGALLNDLFKKMFIGVAIYFIVVRDYYSVLNLTLTPVFETGLSLIPGADFGCAESGGVQGYSGSASAGGGGGLPHGVGAAIVCTVDEIEHKIGLLFRFGDWGFCRGSPLGPDAWFMVFPNLLYLIVAVVFYVAGIAFMVAYPWVMGDAVLQLGIALALAPFAICGYPFSGTKQYLSKVWSWILHSMFVFIFMAILMEAVLGYVEAVLKEALYMSDGNAGVFFTYPPDGVPIYGFRMVKIIFIMFIGWAYMPTVTQLAQEFSAGSGLSAVSAIGSVIKNTVDEKTRQASEWAAGAAGAAALSTAKATKRRVKAGVRQGIQGAVRVMGRNVGGGSKRLGNRFLNFTRHENANGAFLQREYRSITGRRHVMYSDKYTVTREIYDRSGKLIKRETKFKHGFAAEHMFIKDKNGRDVINMGALQQLMNSPMAAHDPKFKQMIMEQVLMQRLKQKGIDVQKYFHGDGRTVKFDPRNPYKIEIIQHNETGSHSTMSLDINAATGNFKVDYNEDIGPTRYGKAAHSVNMARKRTGRKTNIAMVGATVWTASKISSLAKKAVGNTTPGSGPKAWRSLGGLVTYRMVRNAAGQMTYEREMKQFLFFGKKTVKRYDRDGVEFDSTSKKGAKRRLAQMKKRREIDDKIMSHAHSTATTGTGTDYVYKTWNAVYTKHVDRTTGAISYTVAERRYWLYDLLGVRTNSKTLHQDKTVREEVGRGYKTKASKTENVNKFGDSSKTTRKNIDGNTQKTDNQTGEVQKETKFKSRTRTFTDNGMVAIDSRGLSNGVTIADTAEALNQQATQVAHVEDIISQNAPGAMTYDDGTFIYTRHFDAITGEIYYTVEEKALLPGTNTTITTYHNDRIDIVVKDSSGAIVSSTSKSLLPTDVREIGGQVTTFKYSDLAQAGHASIVDPDDTNQIVDSNNVVSAKLGAALTEGLGEINGEKTMRGMNMDDFIVQNVLGEGRRRHTNKMATSIDWGRKTLRAVDSNGKVWGRIDTATGVIVDDSGARVGTMIGGKIFDASGNPAGKGRFV